MSDKIPDQPDGRKRVPNLLQTKNKSFSVEDLFDNQGRITKFQSYLLDQVSLSAGDLSYVTASLINKLETIYGGSGIAFDNLDSPISFLESDSTLLSQIKLIVNYTPVMGRKTLTIQYYRTESTKNTWGKTISNQVLISDETIVIIDGKIVSSGVDFEDLIE